MNLGIPSETLPGERRVSLVPDLVPKLVKAGLTVLVQAGAGTSSGYQDHAFVEQGATIEPDVPEQQDGLHERAEQVLHANPRE